MRKTIDVKMIGDMAASLENAELGAGLRILGRILSSGKPIPVARLRVVSQMSEEEWTTSSEAILEFFEVSDEAVSHAALRDCALPDVSRPAREQAGKSGELPLVQPTRQKHQVPSWPARETQDRISIKSTAFDILVRLFVRTDQTPNTARSVMASFLKNWPEGDVYQAVAEADRQEFIADPRSWILANLKRNSQPIVRKSHAHMVTTPAPVARKKHELATPEVLGVSNTTAEKIRSRNAAIGLNLKIGETGA